MKNRENGFIVVELAIAISVMAVIAFTATTFTFHSLRAAGQSDNQLAVLSNAQNAGYWISRDAYMADNVIADNLTPPAFLILKWTDWGYGTSNVYHTATYSIEDISGGVGRLKRRHQNSVGADEQIVVANYIYYNLADPTNSSGVTYQTPTINLKVVTQLGDHSEVREYQIYRRPNF